jgi:hypothetical protein
MIYDFRLPIAGAASRHDLSREKPLLRQNDRVI